MRHVPGLILCLILAAPAAACLNDSSTGPAENEFNAAYAGKQQTLGRFFQPLSLLLLTPPVGLVAFLVWLRRSDRLQREREERVRIQRQERLERQARLRQEVVTPQGGT